jgi:hypothetical protein
MIIVLRNCGAGWSSEDGESECTGGDNVNFHIESPDLSPAQELYRRFKAMSAASNSQVVGVTPLGYQSHDFQV